MRNFDLLVPVLSQIIHHYHEFVPDAFIKEPWNAGSSLFFFLPVFYWLFRLKGQYKPNWVLVAILPLMFLNGLGSTLFHANGGGSLYGMLDVLPPLVMMLFLASFFWKNAIGSWRLGILIVLGFLGFNIGLITYLSQFDFYPVNAYYFVSGVMIVLPLLAMLKKADWHGLRPISLAFGLLVLAFVCRNLDYPTPNPFPEILPQGTHFLWHIFSALAAFPLGNFLIDWQTKIGYFFSSES